MEIYNNSEHEIWAPVVEWNGYYEISNYGNVRSVDKYKKCAIRHVSRIKVKGRQLTVKSTPFGYKFIILYRDGKQKMGLIHRLVAKAFIPNPENKPSVNHKDANKANNHVRNLEWVTAKENTGHAIGLNLMHRGTQVAGSKLSENDVIKIRARKGTISGRKLAKEVGISDTVIYDIWNNKIWKHVV